MPLKFHVSAVVPTQCVSSHGCCDKLPQTWWLKTKKFILTVLQTRRSKSVSLGQNPCLETPQAGCRGLGQNPPRLCGFWCLLALLALGLHRSARCLLGAWSASSLVKANPYRQHSVRQISHCLLLITARSHHPGYSHHFAILHLQKDSFNLRQHLQVLGFRA